MPLSADPASGWSVRRRLCCFALAGFVGFAFDAGILTLLANFGLDARLARLASFACAMVVTWLINRSLTFGDRAGTNIAAEFLRYLSASVLSALVNLGAFMALVTLGGPFARWPVLAVGIAVALSMTLNFWSYFKMVFTPETREPGGTP
ncbi:GtrA family protein [Labrys sp. LIt4]|uniref:GtrA family protein n=1 Tax=Labrys sp. LIt4 TaxID=2821355 RepID=UPI001ADFA5AB|nr:GtrA family protein [Labrys sp. LIt4]MBP0579006.1 GtrA family protein [Labrys sp. LIt4]